MASYSMYGIDFGTTNTAVFEYFFTKDQISTTQHGEGDQPFPSLVALHPDKPPLFGMEVKKRRSQLKADGYVVVSSFKSILGNDHPIKVGANEHTPVDVTALFLTYVKERVERATGGKMQDAVIAIPVDFRPEQRRALREAANLAGIHIRSFVSEPTAAYIFCQKKIAGASNVAVFDWGGGTLDVSIISADHGNIHELAVAGKRLGGNDIDEMIARHIHARIMQESGIPRMFEDMSGAEKDQIISRSEDAKKRLSIEDFALIRLMKYGEKAMTRQSISLNEFQKLIAERINDAVQVLYQAAHKASISLGQLDAILMVGGSCEMQPIVKRMEEIAAEHDIPVSRPEDIQWVVAGGAAILAGQNPSYKLQSDFGVLLSDNSIYSIFEAGQRIPCKSPELCFGVVEDTTNAIFVLVDGNKNELKRMVVPIKGFTAEGLHLNASIDEDMIAHVEIKSSYAEKMGKTGSMNQLSFSYCIE